MICIYNEDLANIDIQDDILTEEEIVEEYNKIIKSLDNLYLNLQEDVETSMVTAGVLIIIYMIKKWWDSKFRLKANRYKALSKKIDDIYVKVEDILSHDKLRVLTSGKMKVNFTHRIIFIKDSRDPQKDYYIPEQLPFVDWNVDYLIDLVDKTVKYANSQKDPEKRKEILQKAKDDTRAEVEREFERNHQVGKYFYPVMESTKINNVTFKEAQSVVKQDIEHFYSWTAYINEYITNAMGWVSYFQHAYQSTLARYPKNDELVKDLIDNIFKTAIDIDFKCLEFMDKTFALYVEGLEDLAKNLEDIYKIIRK